MTHKHIHIDSALPLVRQADKGHNRWHPDIAPAVRVASGSSVEMETLDGLDGQIKPGTTAADLAGIEMGRVHPLTGPVHVDGAEPGDLLAVKIEQIVPANRGFTMIMPGFGFLRDLFTTPFLVHWEMADGFAVSPQLPGVRIPGAPFMGVMGVAPSHELLQRIVAREAELLGRGGMVMPPDAAGAVPTAEAIAGKAIRTIAPHETGGNFDIKSLTAGATLYLPVQVPGALFSVGDAHFAQGDGEFVRHRGRDAGDLRRPFRRAEGRGDAAAPARSLLRVAGPCPSQRAGRAWRVRRHAQQGLLRHDGHVAARRRSRRVRRTSRSPRATRSST